MLQVRQATKTYRRGGRPVHAAKAVDLRADEGDLIVVQGPSGSGKTTLLLMIGGMLRPDSGSILLNTEDVYRWRRAKRNCYRRRTVGFVFQRFYLMPYLTLYDNIRLSLGLQGRRRGAKGTIEDLARRLGIEDRLRHTPDELSVGEQQRAALARALVADQRLILADEPTGNLDQENARLIADCLIEEHRRGRTIVVATHDPALVEIGTKRVRLDHGEVVGGSEVIQDEGETHGNATAAT